MQTTIPSLQIFDRTTQDQGSFDAGRITEYKVIGMPQDRARTVKLGDMAILQNPKAVSQSAAFTSHTATRLVLVDVPLTVDYPLYPQF